MASHAEGSSEAGPSSRPTCAGRPAVAAEAEAENKRRRNRRRERKTPRKKKITLQPRPATAAGCAAQLMETMEKRGVGGGGAPIHAIEKELTRTDVDIEQCRLQLTPDLVKRLLRSPILTDAEKAELQPGAQGLNVAAVDRVNNEYNMVFKHSSCNQYRIVKWAQFCVDHDLTAGQTMVVWVYRQPPPKTKPEESGKLGLVLLYYDQGARDKNQKEMDAQLLDSGFVDCVRALLMLSRGE